MSANSTDPARRRSHHRAQRWALSIVGFVAVLCLMFLGQEYLRAGFARRTLLKEAERTFGPIDGRYLTDVPKRSRSANAQTLLDLSGPLTREVKGGRMKPAHYCPMHADRIDRIARHLSHGRIFWEHDRTGESAFSITYEDTMQRLVQILADCAIERDGRGDPAGARRLLSAGLVVSDSMLEVPELYPALHYLYMERRLAAAARKLNEPDPAWIERWQNVHASLRESLTADCRENAYRTMQAMRNIRKIFAGMGVGAPHGINIATRPAIERVLYCDAATWLRQCRQWVQEDLPLPGHLPHDELRRDLCGSTVYFDDRFTPDIFLFTSEELWQRFNRTVIETEAAARVLAFRLALREEKSPPATPEGLQAFVKRHGLQTGSTYAGGRWIYELASDGEAYDLHFEGPSIPPRTPDRAATLEQRIPRG